MKRSWFDWDRMLGASPGAYSLIACTIVTLQAFVLFAMGQPVICTCGYIKLWHGLVTSPETSQHLMDWYTYSHVLHGLIFYLILWLVAPGAPVGLRFVLAIGLEAGWEILENTSFIIDRYRESALAQGYFGDSVINSISDTLAAALGFGVAHRFPVWASLGLLVGIELSLAFLIRDNLTLNIIQLLYPSEALSKWQLGN